MYLKYICTKYISPKKNKKKKPLKLTQNCVKFFSWQITVVFITMDWGLADVSKRTMSSGMFHLEHKCADYLWLSRNQSHCFTAYKRNVMESVASPSLVHVPATSGSGVCAESSSRGHLCWQKVTSWVWFQSAPSWHFRVHFSIPTSRTSNISNVAVGESLNVYFGSK